MWMSLRDKFWLVGNCDAGHTQKKQQTLKGLYDFNQSYDKLFYGLHHDDEQ